jgi:hypothetical protein
MRKAVWVTLVVFLLNAAAVAAVAYGVLFVALHFIRKFW